MKISRLSPFIVSPAQEGPEPAPKSLRKNKVMKAGKSPAHSKEKEEAEQEAKIVTAIDFAKKRQEKERQKKRPFGGLKKRLALKRYEEVITAETMELMRDNFCKKI